MIAEPLTTCPICSYDPTNTNHPTIYAHIYWTHFRPVLGGHWGGFNNPIVCPCGSPYIGGNPSVDFHNHIRSLPNPTEHILHWALVGMADG